MPDKKRESDEPRETIARLESKIDEIVRSVAEKIVPVIGQRAVTETLQGLLPDALKVAVDEWRQAPLHVQITAIRGWRTDAAGEEQSPLPKRATRGSSGYDLVYCPPPGVSALWLRAQPSIQQAGVSVDKKGAVTIYPGSAALLPTGIAVAVPEGCEAQVRSRSGLATRGVVVDNSPGTVDSDYRVVEIQGRGGFDESSKDLLQPAEIKVLLRNHGMESVEFKPGDRIAQIVFCEVLDADFAEVPVDKWEETVGESDRRGGFGSTGL